MASTGFKAISQVAEILDSPEIDEKSRHFILDLLTRTLGENIQLQDSLIKKEWEIEDLQGKIQEQDEHTMSAWGEWGGVTEKYEEEIKMINESRQKVAKQSIEKDEEIEKHKQTIESLRGQLKEKDKEIGQKTMELRQHSWRSNKMIYELKDELDEKGKELEKIKRALQLKESSPPEDKDEDEYEDEDEDDSEDEDSVEQKSEEPRRRYVAPERRVDDPLVPVMENGEKKWYRRSECCGSHTWSGEELWVRNWM